MSLAGRLEDLAISDIFQILSVGRKTGTFIVNGSKGTAIIVFKNGMVVRAETDDLEGTLGTNLMEAGLVKDTMLNMAVEVKKKLPSKSVAEILFDFGAVSAEVLDKAAKKRIERVIYRLLMWEDGDFQFELDDLDLEGKTGMEDLGWELSRGLSPEYLLMEGARVQDESTQASFISTEELSSEETEEGGGGWDDDWETPAVERKDISALKALTQELRFPNSASEITLLILRFASDIFHRGVLFMVVKTEVVGLGQFGLEIERADEKVRETVLDMEQSPFLKRVVGEQRPYKGLLEKDETTRRLMDELGGVWPTEVTIFPIVAEGRVVAFLYCDNFSTGEAIPETEGLEIFISHAGLALEKSLLQRRIQEMETKKDGGEGG
ncbi:MAG: DUF4388 domain-containing protein [Nitrospiraceae bacterium]|nr:DUF4388 domain-containing protein [Nitrospiraceae bacterium]